MAERSKIPAFRSVQEEAEFWDNHSPLDFLDELEPAEVTFAPDAFEKGRLREAFAQVFPNSTPVWFGDARHTEGGVSDGNPGVQWNAGIEFLSSDKQETYLGVNLEGIEYGERRPIAHFIKSERDHPRIFEVIRNVQRPQDVEVRLMRDAWQGRARPRYFTERFILKAPLASLTEEKKNWREIWRVALYKAQECLDVDGKPVQMQITFYDPRTCEVAPRPQCYKITPHLGFRTVLWQKMPTTRQARVDAMKSARDRMMPLYEFVKARSA
jgi:hypothetical protein